MKLALGTVQFGQPYGIANKSGQVNHETAAAILAHANAQGIDTLDTAIAYGESELCLGKIGVQSWQVITKLPKLPDQCTNIATWVEEQVQGSLTRLKLKHLSGLLLHHPLQLLEANGSALWAALEQVKDAGLVDKIGFSIYDPEELDKLSEYFRPDLVQAPFNFIDRRLATSGWLKRLNDSGVEVHTRSVFLQGVLLMNPSDRPEKFRRWNNLWSSWETGLKQLDVSPIELCLSFAINQTGISKVVVGIDNLRQLEEILLAMNTHIDEFPPIPEVSDQDLLNPSRWSNL